MADNLKKDTIKALIWSFLERLSKQGLQFVFSVILARILLPSEFGLIAMLTVFVAFGNAFINSGFSHALIQKKDATFEDECSVFYFNLFVSVIATILLYLGSPFIAEFYDQPQLIPMTRVLSLIFIFNATGLIQRTLLTKKLDFNTQLKVSVLTTLISGIVSLIFAFKGFGVWSLVILYLTNDFTNTVLMWAFTSWRPRLIFSIDALRSMLSFGSRLLIVSLLNSVFNSIYQLVIGKFYNPASLGFYSRADSLYKYPVDIVASVVSQVSFPIYSRIQDDKLRLKNAVSKSVSNIAFLIFPVMVGLMVVAEPLVEVLLTEKWLPSVPYLQMLCVIGMIKPLLVINGNIINAQGRSDLYLKIDLINKVMVLVSVAITYRFGITGMIIGQILYTIITYYLYSYSTDKVLGFSVLSQIKELLPSFFISVFMGLIVFLCTYLKIENLLIQLIVQIVVGVFIYFVLCILFKINEVKEISSLINELKKRF